MREKSESGVRRERERERERRKVGSEIRFDFGLDKVCTCVSTMRKARKLQLIFNSCV